MQLSKLLFYTLLPAVGATFIGKVLDFNAEVMMVDVPGFRDEQALGLSRMPVASRPKHWVGNAARVEFTGVRRLKSGRIVANLCPAPLKKG